MTITRALIRAPLGFPWATAILVMGCVLTTSRSTAAMALGAVLGLVR
jgi:hypothetical protein